MQCHHCALCCHKKCVAKCQLSTACLRNNEDDAVLLQPEIIMTEAAACCDNGAETGGIKRVNSVNSLTIPGSSALNMSKSLPPSPQRTPSRKQSIVIMNPFVLCPGVLDDVQKQPNEAGENVNKLLEQVMLCVADESLMDVAKETGMQLYAGMPHEERVEKINLMVSCVFFCCNRLCLFLVIFVFLGFWCFNTVRSYLTNRAFRCCQCACAKLKYTIFR